MKEKTWYKTALITGCTGQTGSYLVDLLIKKGYRVIGLRRRTSTFNTQRVEHLYTHPNFIQEWGNITDSSSLWRLLKKYQPDEIYNMAAQSHVRVSFDVPEETLDVVAGGTLKLLNAYKELCPKARFYQASSSEMFGDNPKHPQNEETKFMPASPYACSKVFAHNLCRNYRKSYGLHISCGILFNHETITATMPIIFKEGNGGEIDIKPIGEIVRHHTTNREQPSIDESKPVYQETKVDNKLYVWDKEGWTKVLFASGYPHSSTKFSKRPKLVIAKNGAVIATGTHEHIMDDEPDKKFKDIKIGDKISLIPNFPDGENALEKALSLEDARFIGFVVGDGNLSKDSCIRLTAKDKNKLEEYRFFWEKKAKKTKYQKNTSGFNKSSTVWQLHLRNATDWIKEFIPDLYTEDKKKRVPKIILNSSEEIQRAFLEGYNSADGLKTNRCIYEFKNFKTNSATLALGLVFLLEKTTGQNFNVNVEYTTRWGREDLYYSINVLSNSRRSLSKSLEKYNLVKEQLASGKTLRQISRDTGISRKLVQQINRGYKPTGKHHFSIENNKVKKIISLDSYDGWFYDLETESGTFHCGIGKSHVHNSPRRGETFVTRKISQAAARIKLGLQDEICLGNLDAKRDWGYAGDFVEGIWLMLQQDEPDDYVLATGENHSVKEFLEETFELAELEIEKYLKIDEKYFRPHEVPELLGDAGKAERVLGWKSKIRFKELVKMMYIADLKEQAKIHHIPLAKGLYPGTEINHFKDTLKDFTFK